MLYHVFDRWLGIRLKRMTTLLDIESPQERLSSLIRDNINMVAQYRCLCRTWVYSHPKLDAPIAAECKEKSRKIVHLACDVVDECVKAGVIPSASTRVMAEVFFAPPFSIYAWRSPDDLPPEKVAKDMLAVLGLEASAR